MSDRRKWWRAPSIQRAVDLSALLILAGLAVSGVILRFVLPRPRPAGGEALSAIWDLTFAGCGRGLWRDAHFWLGFAFLLVIAAHLLLHGAWIRRNLLSPRNDDPRRTR
jgi:hypothetical protein